MQRDAVNLESPNPRLQRTRSASPPSPLSRQPLGARRQCTALIAAALLSVPVAVRSEIIISHGASPAGHALQLIATGHATPDLLAEQIVDAAEKYWSYPLMPRLLLVLDAYFRDGETQRQVALEAFALAERRAKTEGGRSLISKSFDTLKNGVDVSHGYATPRPGWFQHNPQISLDVPITRRSRGEWTMPIFDDRMASLLEQHLTKENRHLYVREAFQAFLAPDCKILLEGRLASTCEEAGLFTVQYQALRLAFGGLNSDGRDPAVAEIYISQEPATLEAVLARAVLIHPGGFYRQCSILGKWLRQPPSRWEVWADLEPELH